MSQSQVRAGAVDGTIKRSLATKVFGSRKALEKAIRTAEMRGGHPAHFVNGTHLVAKKTSGGLVLKVGGFDLAKIAETIRALESGRITDILQNKMN